MGLGITTYALALSIREDPAEWTPRRVAEWAVKEGAPLVQFCENLPLGEAGEIEGTGIRAQTGLRGLDPEEHRRHRDLALALGASLVRVVIDKAGFEPSWEEAREGLGTLEKIYGGSGVKLAVENHDRFGSPDLLALIDGWEDWCGICLDTANSLGSFESPADTIHLLAPVACSFHIKDVAIRRVEHQMGFVVEGTAVGRGMVPLEGILAMAKRSPIDLLVEQWPPHSDLRPETEQRLVREGLDFLRKELSL
jgi:sugar phosphate isomerase/epimerase